ncbi:hypothetical protein ACERK3_09960 [Phycisphaerales bacterium AB-hyl4]|uniref:Uncharacterized protein n=1 Tax=Natronomicrosphaera hydrolytica TaxID=3242702 RepID=A0ABV4U713_9BACT
MSKQQMIEAIRERNRSVSSEYLVKFDERALQNYLRRLTDVLGHRGRESRWVREGGDRAVVTRTAV